MTGGRPLTATLVGTPLVVSGCLRIDIPLPSGRRRAA